MSETSQLTIKNNFDLIGKNYQLAKNKLIEEENKAMDLIKNNSKKEKEALDKAFENYNKKVEQIISSKEFKTIENNAKEYSNDLSHNLTKAKNEFIKIRDNILKQDWSEQKKQKKINELYNYILNKLYSKEEVEKFQNMMNNIIIIMPKKKIKI